MRENSKQILQKEEEKEKEKENGQGKVGKNDEEGEIRGVEGEMDGRGGGGGGEVQIAAGPAIERDTAASTTDVGRWLS